MARQLLSLLALAMLAVSAQAYDTCNDELFEYYCDQRSECTWLADEGYCLRSELTTTTTIASTTTTIQGIYNNNQDYSDVCPGAWYCAYYGYAKTMFGGETESDSGSAAGISTVAIACICAAVLCVVAIVAAVIVRRRKARTVELPVSVEEADVAAPPVAVMEETAVVV